MKKTPRASCPVCNATQTALKYRIERHHFNVFICASCHCEFQYPFPKNADAFYDEGYYTGASAFNYQDERQKEHYHNFVHRARLKSIRNFLSPSASGSSPVNGIGQGGDKLLDVGCAFGAFVRATVQENFEAVGLDVSSYAVKEGNRISEMLQNSARLFEGDLSSLPKKRQAIFAPESFAAITMIEVAEHLQTPCTDLATAFQLLKPGGLLVIQTANFEGLQATKGGADFHYYLPGHLIYYTASGLKNMLRQIGFREFKEFFPVDFSLWAKWRKAWGDIHRFTDLIRFWRMSLYHWKSKLTWRGRPLTSSYVLYARK